jgi:PAS domain S-box-containing protein
MIIMNKENLQTIIDSSPFGFAYHEIIVDDQNKPIDYRFLQVNPAFEQLTGLTAEHIIGKTIREVIPGIENTHFDWIGYYGAIALQGGNDSVEQFSEPLKRWYQVSVSSPKRGFFTTFFVDITAQKKQSDELESFFSVSPDLLCIVDMEGTFIKTNQAWQTLLGYTPSDLANKKILEFIHPDDMQSTLETIVSLGQDYDVLNFTNRYRCQDGAYKYLEWRSHFKDDLIYAAGRDVTEKIQQTQEIADNRLRLELAMDAGEHGFWDWDLITNATYFSPRYYTMLGYADRELPMHFATFKKLLHPDDAQTIMPIIQQRLTTGQPYSAEFRLLCKGGGYRWINGKGRVYHDAHQQPYRAVGVHIDINDRKIAEIKLRAERELFSKGPVITIEWDAHHHWPVSYVSENVLDILGYSPEEMKSENFVYADLIHRDDLSRISEEVAYNSDRHIDTYEQSYRLRHRDGSYRWFYDFNKLIRDDQHQLIAIRGYLFDQSKLKEIEQDLAQQSRRLNDILTGTNVGTWEWNVQTGAVVFNERWAAIVGYTLEELAPISIATWTHLAHPDDFTKSGELLNQHFNGQLDYYEFESRMRHKSGAWVWVLDRGKVSAWTEDGCPLFMSGTHQDITDRKHAEEAFRNESEKNRILMQHASDGLHLVDLKGYLIQANASFCAMLGYRMDELIGRHVSHWDHQIDQDQLMPLIRHHFVDGQRVEFNSVHRRRDGTLFAVEVSGTPVILANNQYMFYSSRDITERKRTEEALKASEANFRAFFDSMQDMVIVGAPDGRVLYANDAVIRKLGYNLDELNTLGVLGIHCHHHRAEAEAIFAAMLRGERDFCPLPIQSKDGMLIPVETRVSFGQWNGQNCVFGISKDLSAEMAALQKFDKLFAVNPAMMTLSRLPENQIVEVNQAFLDNLGLTSAEVIGKTMTELELFVDAHVVQHTQDRLQRDGVIHNMEIQLRTVDGTIRDQLLSGEQFEVQGVCYFLTVMIDITKRKQAEAAQANTAVRLALATKAGGVGVWDWDCVANVLIWDEQMYALYGIPTDRFSGAYDAWRQGLHPDDLHRCDQEIAAALTGDREFNTEFRIIWPDGSIHQIRALATVQRDENGQPLRMIGTNWDITAQKQAEQLLIAAKEQAEVASKAKSEFLANMSHEIRTPLNGVIGFTDLLKTTPLSSVQQQYVNNANVSGHTLLGIINDILDFSKIEAGMLELELVKTDMIELLEDSVDIVKFAAGKKNLEMLLNIDDAMPRFAHVDSVRLKQILANLLGNAVKFTETGEVELKVTFQMRDDDQGTLAFSVRDTGIGIHADHQAKLFKAFSQADSSTTRKFGGTGLGLVISNMIAAKMGSAISIKSTLGVGTTFFFDITTTVETGAKRDITEIAQVRRCLVVDDNANNRLILEHMLQQWQITCQSCDSGFAALKQLKTSPPFDVIICDYNMPYLDGLETIRMIRDQLKLSSEKQPVILLHSSSEHADLHQQCEQLAIRFRLSKPVKRNDLFNYLCNLQQAPRDAHTVLEQESPSIVSHSDPTSEKIKILVAEDVPMNLTLIKAILPKLVRDADIFEATNGQQAVEQYEAISPDLVLMDVQMPVLDGLAATRRIRMIEAAKGIHVPIIALTAGALKEEMEKCFAAGMDDFLTKPIRQEKTKEILDKHLECRKKEPVGLLQTDSDDAVHFGYHHLAQNLDYDDKLIREILLLALKEMPVKIQQLEQACSELNARNIHIAAHALKGASLSMRFTLMAELTKKIEHSSRDACFDNLQETLSELKQAWATVATVVKKQLRSFDAFDG